MRKNYYHQHQELLEKIIIRLQKEFGSKIKIYSRVTGMFYTKSGAPVKISNKGQADLYGWILIDNLPVHLEIEVKSGKTGIRKGSHQEKWMDKCRKDNVIFIIGQDPELVVKDIYSNIERIKNEVDARIL